jgi:uncharacterized protein (DUF1697 family)
VPVTTYIALLRGVNVGGRSKLAMADLRRVLESIGYADVRTYLQSGNAVFSSARKAGHKLSAEIEKAISADLGLDVKVFIRTKDEMQSVVDANPYPKAVATPTQLHVMFLSAEVPADVVMSLDAARFEPDEFRFGDRVIYLLLPNGLGRSKLPSYLCERTLGVSATTRNWNTVAKLAAT